MANIEAGYAFHGRDPYAHLNVTRVMDDGTIDAELFDAEGVATKVYGTYDAATNRVSFSEAATPAEELLNTFFKGFAILDASGNAVALAGTWTEQRLSYGPGLIFNGVVYDHGGWYADTQPPIH